MFGHRAPALLLGAALLALPLHAASQPDRPEIRLIEKYDRFAGSGDNARSLVEGLHNDTRVELSKDGKSTTFDPPTRRMGYGNVDISLALAKALLAEHGIRNPTPEQIKAALVGGTVANASGHRVTLEGVLKLRAIGRGWGQIARRQGFRLGDVMRPDEHEVERKPAQTEPRDAGVKPQGRPDPHRVRLDRPQLNRPEKIERPERIERPQHPERPDRPQRPERPERPERHGRH